MAQKVVITDSEKTINDWLSKGWKIVSITAREITGGGSGTYGFRQGDFCFVIEKLNKPIQSSEGELAHAGLPPRD
jgi:hypothetical protein